MDKHLSSVLFLLLTCCVSKVFAAACDVVDDFPNHPSVAAPANSPSSFGGTSEYIADRDVFEINLLPFKDYTFTLMLNSLADGELRLIDGDGKSLLDYQTTAGAATTTQVIYNAASVGKKVFLDIRPFAEFYTGSYTVSIAEAGGPDGDFDTLPDAWEDAVGLDKTDGTGDNGRFGDPDGDKFTNEEEFIMGTLPNDPSSGLYVRAIEKATTGVDVVFPAVQHGTYRVYKALPGASLSFVELGVITHTEANGDHRFNDPSAEGEAYNSYYVEFVY